MSNKLDLQMCVVDNTCCICLRQLGDDLIQDHHLIPKTFKGTETVPLHKICHQKIHSVFDERSLLHYYHTPERILENEEIQKFVKWVRTKPLDYYSKNDETAGRRSKRRR